ncbi:MAG: hypothetical protein ABJK37_23495 [Paraglaciecola sp.]|uniref:hypothetical protein n=1 Tax=Paraglaciecola sp. TaxID=1920173 RepID=UPI003298140F
MFIGHYAASFALKSCNKNASLGFLFIAVQFVDILFFPLTLLGIEHFRLIENFTEATHFSLDFMPYSHSLVATFFWGAATFTFVFFALFKHHQLRLKLAMVFAIAVISHWFFDLLVHTPDLPLITDNSLKVGFGLWNNDVLTYILESVILIAGLYLYMRSSTGVTKIAKYGMPVFIVVLLGINIINIFGPLSPQDNETTTAVSAVVAYFAFALIAWFLDRNRVSNS